MGKGKEDPTLVDRIQRLVGAADTRIRLMR